MHRTALAFVVILIGATAARADATADCQRASATYAARDVDVVIRGCTELLQVDPNSALAYHNRGFALLRMRSEFTDAKEDYNQVVADYTKALEVNQSQAAWYVLRARAYLKAGQAARGLPDVERSLALDPDHPFAITARGEILEALGRTDEAIADYRKVAAKHAQSPAMNHLRRLGVLP